MLSGIRNDGLQFLPAYAPHRGSSCLGSIAMSQWMTNPIGRLKISLLEKGREILIPFPNRLAHFGEIGVLVVDLSDRRLRSFGDVVEQLLDDDLFDANCC